MTKLTNLLTDSINNINSWYDEQNLLKKYVKTFNCSLMNSDTTSRANGKNKTKIISWFVSDLFFFFFFRRGILIINLSIRTHVVILTTLENRRRVQQLKCGYNKQNEYVRLPQLSAKELVLMTARSGCQKQFIRKGSKRIFHFRHRMP